jgi:hypothetical protein
MYNVSVFGREYNVSFRHFNHGLHPSKKVTLCQIRRINVPEKPDQVISLGVREYGPLEQFNKNNGRKDALKDALMLLWPKQVHRKRRRVFWKAYFAARHGKKK